MGTAGSRYGLTHEQWATAIDEVRDAILDAAYDRRMTWYGEVTDRLSVVELDPRSPSMSALLGAVFEDEHKAGRPALTSIVPRKYGDKEPGPGFYDKGPIAWLPVQRALCLLGSASAVGLQGPREAGPQVNLRRRTSHNRPRGSVPVPRPVSGYLTGRSLQVPSSRAAPRPLVASVASGHGLPPFVPSRG